MTITEDLLFKYFRGKASRDEKIAISHWLGESKENRMKFREASDLYEQFIMTAPADMLDYDNSSQDGEMPQKKSWRIWRAVADIAAVAAVTAGIWLAIDHRYENKMEDSMVTVEIPTGHRMDIILADGTTVKLNSGARMQYPQSFSSSSREVYLDGEAFFDVPTKSRSCWTS
ncbi:MAG: FecR domain-containing protein [Bacteroidales bacterium]|nr:FecR domain-containing protein [Bacteroidales bacterium]MDY6001138.1 FecR domain-containing protein [Candidatus Cryptobacteroides sp.]